MDRPVKAIILGYGIRGRAYAAYAYQSIISRF